MMRAMLGEVWDEFALVDTRLAAVTRQVESITQRLDAAKRLMSIPGPPDRAPFGTDVHQLQPATRWHQVDPSASGGNSYLRRISSNSGRTRTR